MKRDAVMMGIAFLVLVVAMVWSSGCAALGGAFCDLMSGSERDECYFNIGDDNEDPAACAKIGDLHLSFSCYEAIARDLEDATYCGEMKKAPWYGSSGTPPVEECYDFFAVDLHSPDACKNIDAGFSSPRTVTADPILKTVSQADCMKEISQYCGKPGNRACRAMSTKTKPVPEGDPMAYYCNSGAHFPGWELCPE